MTFYGFDIEPNFKIIFKTQEEQVDERKTVFRFSTH